MSELLVNSLINEGTNKMVKLIQKRVLCTSQMNVEVNLLGDTNWLISCKAMKL